VRRVVDTECERHRRGGVCVFACVDTITVYVGSQKYESVKSMKKSVRKLVSNESGYYRMKCE
jgi:hypothetical protein